MTQIAQMKLWIVTGKVSTFNARASNLGSLIDKIQTLSVSSACICGLLCRRYQRLLGAALEARRQQIDLERRTPTDDIQSLLIGPGEREVLRRA
jgi:hypothetical protein